MYAGPLAQVNADPASWESLRAWETARETELAGCGRLPSLRVGMRSVCEAPRETGCDAPSGAHQPHALSTRIVPSSSR